MYVGGLSCNGLALFWVLSGFIGLTGNAHGAPPDLPPTGAARVNPVSDAAISLLAFSIPAQPLNAALNQYADITGQPALFSSDIAHARTSTAVYGHHSAEAALRILLEGTGLVADRRSSGLGQTFILKEAAVASAAPASTLPRNGMAELFSEDGYAGLVQMRIWQALCSDARTRPGNYTSLLRFYLETDGRIGGVRLLGSSGDPRRDAALLHAVRGVRVGRLPPAAIARQPLTMMVASSAPGVGPQCGQQQGEG
ncbi:TonB C-terminal domain-containing protein [Janthinobacterium sp. 13]|uniref:TonB C-terminal domain-containing protein n=1 Tax=Janthinobacterium sp. 13 TaxID=2035211 RepID=UPI000C16A8B1|nr:TonB C-terminal domain-containing protein [Janthinobacterium sp. 13]PIF13033.1 TonB family protein [Janthinobacterium sp. 13]